MCSYKEAVMFLNSLASTLMMAVNVLRYVTATPPPVPEPDSVRYKVSPLSPLQKLASSDTILCQPLQSFATMRIPKRWNFKDVSVASKGSASVNRLMLMPLPVDNPGGPLLPNGEQLYELVRDADGEGWAIQEARIPTVLPGWQNVTFSPWYR